MPADVLLSCLVPQPPHTNHPGFSLTRMRLLGGSVGVGSSTGCRFHVPGARDVEAWLSLSDDGRPQVTPASDSCTVRVDASSVVDSVVLEEGATVQFGPVTFRVSAGDGSTFALRDKATAVRLLDPRLESSAASLPVVVGRDLTAKDVTVSRRAASITCKRTTACAPQWTVRCLTTSVAISHGHNKPCALLQNDTADVGLGDTLFLLHSAVHQVVAHPFKFEATPGGDDTAGMRWVVNPIVKAGVQGFVSPARPTMPSPSTPSTVPRAPPSATVSPASPQPTPPSQREFMSAAALMHEAGPADGGRSATVPFGALPPVARPLPDGGRRLTALNGGVRPSPPAAASPAVLSAPPLQSPPVACEPSPGRAGTPLVSPPAQSPALFAPPASGAHASMPSLVAPPPPSPLPHAEPAVPPLAARPLTSSPPVPAIEDAFYVPLPPAAAPPRPPVADPYSAGGPAGAGAGVRPAGPATGGTTLDTPGDTDGTPGAAPEAPPKRQLPWMARAHLSLSYDTRPQACLTAFGCKVFFPPGLTPFPSQRALMAKMIQGIMREEHALLESPTGTGKTLALLAASLATQEYFRLQRAEVRARNADAREAAVQEAAARRMAANAAMQAAIAAGQPFAGLEPTPVAPPMTEDEPKIPRIYFASRTHSQLAQAVEELKACSHYHNVVFQAAEERTGAVFKYDVERMGFTTLGSREQYVGVAVCVCVLPGMIPLKRYCVHPTIKHKPDRDDLCRDLMDSHSPCSYGHRAPQLAKEAPQVFSIEELVETGTALGGCPYFASRELFENADVVFVPYNYLIDPVIRDTMEIKLKNTILIFDEAHNMEDISRDAASMDLDRDDLKYVVQEFETFLKHDIVMSRSHYAAVQSTARALLEFVEEMYRGDREKTQHYLKEGPQALQDFAARRMVHPTFGPSLGAVFEDTKAALHDKNIGRGALRPTVPMRALKLLERLAAVMGFMGTAEYTADYRVAITTKRLHGGRRVKYATTLSFWCMNPAVAFAALRDNARTIVLTSGTLSPLDSFAQELGVDFRIRLEAPHVINPVTQLYACTVPKCPRGYRLKGVYDESLKCEYQDGVGETLIGMANVVPNGMLVFFTSYRVLGDLRDRWQVTGLWDRLNAVKEVFEESRSSAGFKTLLEDYRASIMRTAEGPVGTVTGAIMLAVCRGKVSEGMDFRDQDARAVVCVGIPFPSLKDKVVDLKKKYQDMQFRKHSRPGGSLALDGRQWYSQQAYRALNQALGRCIRHIRDYGAIVMLDERFNYSKGTDSLSRWVRTHVQRQEKPMNLFLLELQAFFQKAAAMFPVQAREDPPPPPPAPVAAAAGAGGAGGLASFWNVGLLCGALLAHEPHRVAVECQTSVVAVPATTGPTPALAPAMKRGVDLDALSSSDDDGGAVHVPEVPRVSQPSVAPTPAVPATEDSVAPPELAGSKKRRGRRSTTRRKRKRGEEPTPTLNDDDDFM